MVALVTGNGVGLGNSSANVLGQAGQLGIGQLPGAAGNAYVNASNGNLIIQRQDELLIGRGPDIGVYQTYNSKGTLDFDNGDNWQLSLYRQISGLTGSGVNTAGSTITRTSGDGTTSIYTYDGVSRKYISKDGSGSYDTLSYDSASKVWTWQDGDSRITESYSTSDATVSGTSKWRITTVTDLDNNRLTYSYNTTTGLTDLIDTVTTENGEVTKLIYNNNKQLVRIDVIQGSVTTSRVSYAYDGNNRLSQVTTDLTPETAGDSKTYVTTYTYVDSTSKQIASISNSDGTKVGFSYDGSGRVTGIKDYTNSDSSESHTTIISYGSSSTTITTTNNANVSQVTTLTYDANGQLTNLQGPSQSGQNSSYIYNSNGDVMQVTDNRGNWTKYTYDTKGNQVSSQDNLGNTVTKTYGANNQLLSQTTYTTPDANVSDSVLAASGAQTTYYVYSTNGKNQLRFVISPEGRVTEYRYNSNGQVESTLQYAAGTFDVSALASSSQDFSSNADGFIQSPLPDGYALVSGALQVSSKRQTTTTYPFLSTASQPLGTRFTAEVTTQTLSSALLSIGITAGTWANANYRRQWVTLNGSSLQLDTRIGGTALPTNTIGTVKANTTYVVEAATESNGDSTLYFYEKGQPRETGYASQINLGSSNPSFSMQTFNGPGAASQAVPTNTIRIDNLQMQMAPQEATLAIWATQNASKLQRTDYVYDLLGQVKEQIVFTETDAAGVGIASTQMKTLYTYDTAGNLRQKIDPRGTATNTVNDYMTSYSYDGLNRLTVTKQYDATGLEARSVSTVTAYNEGSRQVTLTLANGLVTTSTYDLAGRLMSVQKTDASATNLGTVSYAYDNQNNLRTVTDELGNITYYLYDSANRKVGEIDENKNLTEWVYNANGQVIRTIQYKNTVTALLDGDNTFTNTINTAGVRNKDTGGADRIAHKLYDAAGRLAKEIDALGYVTEYIYDGASRLIKTISYANALNPTQLNAINIATVELLASNSNTIPVPDATNDRVNRNLYENDGKLVGTLDAEGYLTEYTYDKAGRQLQKVRYATATNASNWATGDLATLRGNATDVPADTLKHQTINYIYDAAGQLTGVVDAENYLTEYQYDLVGNKAQEIRYANSIAYVAGNTIVQSRPASNNEDQKVTSTYDENNRLTSSLSNTQGQVNGLLTNYTYDNVGNLTQTVKTFTGATNLQERVQRRQYDSRGNLITELSPVGVAALNLLGASPTQPQIDAIWNSYGTRYSYDNAGRLISKTEPNGLDAAGNRTLYYYDKEGKLIYTINALGEVTGTEYNSFDQVIKTRRYNIRISATTLGNLNGGLAAIPAATITALQNGGASDIQLGYDKRGQLISTTDELNNINSRSYNAFGEVKDRTDKTEGTDATVTRYEYDRRGLLGKTTEDYSETNGINRITRAVYDAFGRVTQTTDGRSNTIKHAYDRLGREVTTTDALSKDTITTYDAFSRVLTRKDGRTNTVTYSYNTATRTMTMTTAEGVVMETVKNHFGETVSIKDGRGSITTYQYNLDGQLTITTADSGTDKLNLVTENIYDAAGRIYQTKDARGTVTQYSYDPTNRVFSKTVDPTTANPSGLNLTTNYRYDAQGRQIWTQDAKGIWTRMDYDKKGQLTLVVTDPAEIPDSNSGVVTGTSPNANALNLKTSYTYDARGKKLTVVEGYDTSSARTTQYKYDKLGRLIESIVDPGNGKLNLTTKYTYDQNDNVVLKTDANNNKTVYTYDANDLMVYTVDALGYLTRSEYDANGNVVKKSAFATPLSSTALTTLQGAPESTAISPAPNGTNDRATRYAYDKDNRVTHITDADWYVTRNEFDANGNVVKRTSYANVATAAPDNGTPPTVAPNITADRVEVTVYDAANRVTYVTDAEGYVKRNEYDTNGNVVKRTSYWNKATAVPIDGTAPTVAPNTNNDRISQTVYDSANRATYKVDALNYLTEIKYDDNSNIIKVSKFYNKMLGTLVTNQKPNVTGTASSGNYVLTSSLDRVTVNTWDNAGRLKTTQTGADASITYSYDATDNRIQAVQSGVTTKYQYDIAGRLVDEIRGFNTGLANTTHYTYDAAGNQTLISEGYNTSVQRDTQQVFDALGRKIQVTDALGKMTTTEYNAFGDIVKVTDANNKSGFFYMNKRGLITLQVNPDGAAIGTAYNAFGSATTIVAYTNRVTAALTTTIRPTITQSAATDQKQTISYNKLGQKFWVQTYWGIGANDFYTDGYTYNAFGDVSSVKARNGAYTSYDYDRMGRKITEGLPISSYDGSGALKSVYNNFTYDAYGNLATKTEAYGLPEARLTSYQYDNSNRLTKEQKQAFVTFDPVTGQTPTVTPAVNKTYDVLGRLTTETDAKGNKTWYYYDVLDRQVGKVDASGVYTKTNYDAVNNKTSVTVYANKVQLSGNATQNTSTLPTLVGATPTSTTNVVYVLEDPDNDRTTYYSYDGVGRVKATDILNITTGVYNVQTKEYAVSTGNITTQNVYDAMGNLIKEVTGATRDTSNNIIGGNVNRTWYNNAGQAVAKLDAEGYLTTWTRDVYGNISKETRYATKPANAVTNALNVTDSTTLAQITTTAATLGSSEDRITDMTFDRLNRTVTETVKAVVKGSVDSTGVLTDTTGDVITSYLYNGLNKVTQKTDGTGAITNYTYDNIGRTKSELRPTYTDFTGGTVRPETAWEYDGLSNVRRELKKGADNTVDNTKRSGQVESDDQITTYEYGTNGLLTAEIDAMGARTEYLYEANGNVTKETLFGRVDASGASTNDVTIYTYDALNRQGKTTDQGTGVIQEAQYNSFNQIAGKRTYTTSIPPQTPTSWDEYTQYDRAGKVWKSNAGDGVTKIYVSDRNGNATARIISTVDVKNMSIPDVRALSAGQTMYTYSVYDHKNQLLESIQPTMVSTREVLGIQQVAGQTVFVGGGSAVGTQGTLMLYTVKENEEISQGETFTERKNFASFAMIKEDGSVVAWGDPFRGGSTQGISQLNGGIKVTQLYSTRDSYAALRENGSVVIWGMAVGGYQPSGGGYPGYAISTIPSLMNGNIKVKEVFITTYPSGNGMQVFFALREDGSMVYFNGYDHTEGVISGLNESQKPLQTVTSDKGIAVLRENGSVVSWGVNISSTVLNQLNGSTIKVKQIYPFGGGFIALREDGSLVGWGNSAEYFINSSIPKATRLLSSSMVERADGSIATWPTTATQNGQLTLLSAQYDGSVKYTKQFYGKYLLKENGALTTWLSDASFNSVANQLDGTIKVVSVYTTGTAYAALREDGSVVTWGNAAAGGDSSSVASKINGINGKVVKIYSTSLRPAYAAFAALLQDGSVVSWGAGSTGNMSQAVAAALNGNIKVTAIYSTEFAFSALRENGSVISWGPLYETAQFNSPPPAGSLDSGVRIGTDIYTDTFVIRGTFHITEPVSTAYIDISYRPTNSTGEYVTVRVNPASPGSGIFDWDAAAIAQDSANQAGYSVQIRAYDAEGLLLNQTNTTLVMGSLGITVHNTVVTVPQILRIKPVQTNISYARLGYRIKGSTTGYTTLNVNVTASINTDSSKEYRFELPSTLSGEYEYTYTAYATDTVDINGDKVLNPLGTGAGYFTAGNNGTSSRLDWVVEDTEIGNNAIKRSQNYNAFGEVVSETDGRGNTTNYIYNTMGAMIKEIAPTVSITKEDGRVDTTARPTIEYSYDAIGRVIAVKDANGNLNTQVWLAGSSVEGSIILEKHADFGIKKAGFDIFGNKRTEFDELAENSGNYTISPDDAIHRTDYTYDKENRLTRIDRQARSVGALRSYDAYAYDAAGNRISHTTTSDITTLQKFNDNVQIEKTFYDSLGRVTQTRSFMEFDTFYTYTYINDVVGVGVATVGGWQKVTKDATERTLIDKTDMFNHVTWHQDLGGRQFTYVYNQAGWLTSQTSLGTGAQFSGQNIAYEYYNNGNIKAIHDKALGMYTYYEYDADGNRTFEGYISLKDASNFTGGAKDYYQYASITYDAMNRMISMVDPKASIQYEYDAVGNRRMVKSTYHDGVNGNLKVEEYWYKYDRMNRFLITMGKLNGDRGVGTIELGERGTTESPNKNDAVSIVYNKAGQRESAEYAKTDSTESYVYTNDGYLTTVKVNTVLTSKRTNDALGRVTKYEEFGSGYTKNTFYDKDNRVTKETGTDGITNFWYYNRKNDVDADGNPTYSGNGVGALAYTKNDPDSDGSDETGTIDRTFYAYEYWDEAKQFAITNKAYNSILRQNNDLWKPGYSELKYNFNGHLTGANDAGLDGLIGTSDDRNFRYVNDAQGLVLLRDEVAGGTFNRVQRYYYVDGKRVGDVGNDGDVRTDYVQAMANRKESKTEYKNFKPIASADFDQNYEPISPSYPGFAATNYTVKNGDNLQSIARAVWGDADMWYLIADANGLTSGSTLTAGQVLTIPNKVTNIHNNSGTYRVYNPGEAIGDVNPTLPTAPPPPKKKKKGCGGFASIIVAAVAVIATIYTAGVLAGPAAVAAAGGSTMAAGVSALGAGSLGFGAAFAAGAAGSIAGQLAGNALGVQSGFSWSAVATAGLTSGVLSTGPMKALTQAVGGVVGGGYAAVAARAVVGNVVGQGIGNITGTQKGFNWSSVAISGIGAVAGAAISDKLQLTSNYGALTNGTNFGADLGRAAVSAGSFALTQLVVNGGKINWQQVATDTVTNLIQNRADSYQIHKNAELMAKQQLVADGFTGERINVAGGRGRTDVPVIDLNAATVGSGTSEDPYWVKEPDFEVSAKKGLLATSPSEGGLSIKAGVVDKVKQQAESANIGNIVEKNNKQMPTMNDFTSLLDSDSPYYELAVDQYSRSNAFRQGNITYRLPDVVSQSRLTGIVTQQAAIGWREAFNSNNSLASRLTYGTLALAATPLALAESLVAAPVNALPAAREFGQNLARASLQTDPYERNLDILRAVATGAEAFTNAGAIFSLGRPSASVGQTASEIAALRAEYEVLDKRLTSSVGELRSAGLKDAHHVIQDAAVRDLPGYNTRLAPGVQLQGPSTAVGTPHYVATQIQRQKGGGTLGAEMRIGYKSLRKAGYSETQARQVIKESQDYFSSIGATSTTPTRVPGNRK